MYIPGGSFFGVFKYLVHNFEGAGDGHSAGIAQARGRVPQYASGGVQVGVKHGALSVDHLERTTDAEIEALKGSWTMPTMLPGSSFFLGLPYGRAKDYIKAGLGVALASDYNPGSSPCGDMRFVMAQGCIKMRLTPVEAFNAVTLNSAYAMGISEQYGSITVGKKAALIITEPGWNLTRMAYQYQTPCIRKVLF